ncbi:hypothetical protein JW968_06840 [Candidatus Woesearchaeota archaeon]|nr:hypothetical protein [Candidatus Woesearchaeota archaeon]
MDNRITDLDLSYNTVYKYFTDSKATGQSRDRAEISVKRLSQFQERDVGIQGRDKQ